MNKEIYCAQEHIKNLDKWKEYIAKLKEEKGESNITLEEAANFKFEWDNKRM